MKFDVTPVVKHYQVPRQIVGGELSAIAQQGHYVVDFQGVALLGADAGQVTGWSAAMLTVEIGALPGPTGSGSPVEVAVVLLHVTPAVPLELACQLPTAPEANAIPCCVCNLMPSEDDIRATVDINRSRVKGK